MNRTKNKIDWKEPRVWSVYPNPKAKRLFPTRWDRFLYWLGLKKGEWYIRTVRKSLDEISGIDNEPNKI